MNEPHDPNQTVDSLQAPADTPNAGMTGPLDKPADPLATTDYVPGSASTDGSHSGADVPASGLPAVPGYRVLREIARGGMGKVLAAFDLGLDRDVALKILLPGANADRFVRESKITARLPHPGIPPVHALGTLADGSPFLAMKLIAGQTLAATMKTADRPRLLQAFTQVCQAVGFAHSRGVIHRDLKPANVMVGAFGEVQVMDWGLAKDLANRERERPEELAPVAHAPGSPEYTDRTQAGAVLGTPAFMAPEQARGEATEARADVFALGGILCAILTGKPPFGGKSAREVIQRAGAADLAEAHARLDGCGADAELVALCRRCLSPYPVDRPANAQAVADGLTTYLNGVQEQLQASQRERAVALAREIEQRKRRRVKLALATTVVLLLLGGGAFAWYSDRQATERRTEARNREQQASQGVDANLKLATDLRKQYRFKEAKAALDQATILATGAAPHRRAEVQQARRDLAFVVRLDDIRFRKWMWIAGEGGKGKFNHQIAAPEYRQAFAEGGLDLPSLDPADAAKRIAASAVKAELVAAVDDWALYEPEPGVRNRLLDIARWADPGPWTDRLRDPAVRDDRRAMEKLAKDADPARTSAAALSVLAQRMGNLNLDPAPWLTAAHTAHPADFELAFALALWHGSRRDDQAIGAYEAARALRPDNVAVWTNLGGALRAKERLDEAIACLRKAIELDPKFVFAHSNLGNTLRAKGRLDEAIACFRKAIELAPKLAEAHGSLGVALAGKGQLDEAIACFRKAIELNPKLAEVHNVLGEALHDKGQMDEAMACYQKAIELDPKLAGAHSNLGSILCDVKRDYDGAIACFHRAIELDPKNAKMRSNLGNAMRDKGQLDQAVACYKKSIELDAKDAAVHYNLGNVLVRKGQADEAIASYQKAVAVDPKFAPAHFALGLALYGKGRVDEAIACWRKAIVLDPKDPMAHGALGQALLGQGRYVEARDESARALALLPENHRFKTQAAGQVQACERMVKLEERLPRLLRGEDKANSAQESLDLARMCQLRRLNAASARFSAEAFAADPQLADNLQAQHRYSAACSAALAAAGRGGDAAKLDDAAKAKLRGQALAWLKADLTALGKVLESGPPQARPFIVRALSNWQKDTDLAGIRDKAARAKLPADEQKAFTQLWADVAALLKRGRARLLLTAPDAGTSR